MSALPIKGQEAVHQGSRVAQVLHIMCRQDSCWCLYFKLLFDPSILEPVFSPMQTSNPQSTSDVCVQRSCTTSWLLRRDCGLPTIMLVFMFVVFCFIIVAASFVFGNVGCAALPILLTQALSNLFVLVWELMLFVLRLLAKSTAKKKGACWGHSLDERRGLAAPSHSYTIPVHTEQPG